MIAFIDDHRQAHGVEPICRLLPIAPSTYHAHVAATTLCGPRSRVFMPRTSGSHGARKVWRQLRREGVAVARCTVERLMRAMGLQGAVRGKTAKTTIQDPAAPCPLDRVNRQFYAPAPDRLWVSDFT